MPVTLLLALLALCLVGGPLAVWGWRGRRLNDHPVCRQCRFDLAGQPDPLVTCPECGAGLKRPGSTRRGQRRRRPVALAVGALLVVVPLASVAFLVLAMLSGVDVTKHKPDALLLLELRRAPASVVGAKAAAELLDRAVVGTLPKDRLSQAVDIVLDHQADPRTPWATAMGDLVDHAHTAGVTTEAQRLRFLSQFATFEFAARPTVARGQRLPVVAKVRESRLGGSTNLMAVVSLVEASIDGAAIPGAPPARSPIARAPTPRTTPMPDFRPGAQVGFLQARGPQTPGGARIPGDSVHMLVPLPERLAPGPHVLRVTVAVSARDYGIRVDWPAQNGPDPSAHRITVELPFTLVDTDAPPIEIIPPTAELSDALADELRLYLSLSPLRSASGVTGPRHILTYGLTVTDPPVPFAFTMKLRQGEHTLDLGSVSSGRAAGPGTLNARSPDGSRTMRGITTGAITEGPVDVILTPDPAVAASTVDLTKIYGGEIVLLSDVELRDASDPIPAVPPRARRPSTPAPPTAPDP